MTQKTLYPLIAQEHIRLLNCFLSFIRRLVLLRHVARDYPQAPITFFSREVFVNICWALGAGTRSPDVTRRHVIIEGIDLLLRA